MDALLRRQLESGVVAAMERAGRDVMAWGEDDCALWCANIVRDALGYDPAAPYRGRYTTRNGARRALGPKGIRGALQSAARRHKWKRVAPAMAQPGDVGLAWTDFQGVPVLATVICRATGWFVGRNERGWTALCARDVAVCWSVLSDWQPGGRVTMPRIGKPWEPRTSAAAHEPISTAIGLTALITGLGASTAVAGAIGGAIITVALSIGVSLVASLLQPHAGQGAIDSRLADTSSIRGVQITERQPIPFKRVIVGGAYVGGVLFFEQVKPPYLYVGVLINHGEIAGVDRLFIGTNEIRFSSGLTPDTVLTPIAVANQPDYPSRLRASFRYGASDQAIDPILDAAFTSLDAEFRQRGIATAVYRYHFGADQDEFLTLWGQVARPNAYAVVRGIAAYDPREATQDVDDESTWTWTNNASLIQAWYLTRSYGGRIPTSKIRWDKVADAADYDDEVIGTGDGTLIKRHTIDGVITLNQRPYEVLQKLLTANRGRVLESAGQVWVASSRPKTPIATIHPGIIAGSIKYTAARPKRELVNKLQVRAVAPGQDFQLVDGPILSDSALQTADGEVLPATLALEYTLDDSTNWTRVQRLQKAFMASARLGRTITCPVDVTLLAKTADELIDAVVTFDGQDLFGIADGDYLITSVGFADDGATLMLAMTEYDVTIETDWNPDTDEQTFTLADLDVS